MKSKSPMSDDSSEIDELEYRSRKLNKILRQNASKAEKRRSILDVVKDRAYLLEDQVKLLEKQAASAHNSITRQSCRRRIAVILALILLLILVITGVSTLQNLNATS